MEWKFTAHISKEDCISFFNLCASLPLFLLKSEFKRQTQNQYAIIRAEEIHNEDLRKIQKYVEDNPELTMKEAANIYYDVQGTGTSAMKYERGNLLVPDDEYKNLTTYMRYLHEYYMTQATETGGLWFWGYYPFATCFSLSWKREFWCRVGVLVPAILETLSGFTNVDAVDYVSTLHARYYN